MWNIGNFKNYLSETYERDVYTLNLLPKIKDIVIHSLESVQDVIKSRKNTHEIFGYDLMVDTNFNVWLIEINASPCMEYSTVI
jgi:tubulin monoglycylase TTLL3/8